ncbi:hypothetical protein CHUAL_009216 [Chamberlinius hualienensis]
MEKQNKKKNGAKKSKSKLSKGNVSTETRKKQTLTTWKGETEKAIVKKSKGFYLYVTLGNRRNGRIHISEISDTVSNGQRPLTTFKQGQEINVKPIGLVTVKGDCGLVVTKAHVKRTFVECTARPSVLSDTNSKLRTYNVGDKVTGYVYEHDERFVYLLIGPDVEARVNLLNLSSHFNEIKYYKKHFRKGHGFNFYILEKGPQYYELSSFCSENLESGAIILGKISNTRRDLGVNLKLPLFYKGRVSLTDICDEYKHSAVLLNFLPKDNMVECAIISIDHKTKSAVLSLRNSRTAATKDLSLVVDKEVDWEDIKLHMQLRGFVCGIAVTRLFVTIGRNMVAVCPLRPGIPSHFKSLGAVVLIQITKREELDTKRELSGVIIVSEEDLAMESGIQIPVENKSKSRHQKTDEKSLQTPDAQVGSELIKVNSEESTVTTPRQHLQVTAGFVWDLSQLKEDPDSSEDEDTDATTKVKKTKKRQHTFLEEKLEEERIRNTEEVLMDSIRLPTSVCEFDEKVSKYPDDCLTWTMYIAFHLKSFEIDKARAVAERAISAISFRAEEAKLKIWIALLNIENHFGTQESMQKVLRRALQYNEPFKVYENVVNIYIDSKKYDLAEQIYGTMVKKYSTNPKVWICYGTFLMKNNQPIVARKLMDRSLKSLLKKDHFSLISKFAQLEFKYGDSERGNTLFESILTNYPKRFDIWSIYVDVLAKTGHIEKARDIYKKATTVSASVKKIKFLLHKFVDFERVHGDEDTLAYATEMLSECDRSGETKCLIDDDNEFD